MIMKLTALAVSQVLNQNKKFSTPHAVVQPYGEDQVYSHIISHIWNVDELKNQYHPNLVTLMNCSHQFYPNLVESLSHLALLNLVPIFDKETNDVIFVHQSKIYLICL